MASNNQSYTHIIYMFLFNWSILLVLLRVRRVPKVNFWEFFNYFVAVRFMSRQSYYNSTNGVEALNVGS